MNVRWLALLLAVQPAIAPGGGPGPELERFEFRESHMGSEFTVLIYCNDPGLASRAARSAFDRIARLDAILSDYRPDSELMRLSDRAGGPPVPVGPELFEILRRSIDLSERTDGAFDITINPVVKLWRRARRNRELPDRGQLDQALARVGWRNLELDPERRTARLRVPGMRLDAGGIAKGYASQAALEVLRDHGITRALVAGAGDIVAGEPPPGRDAWVVGIAPIDARNAPERFLHLRDRAVSTSGDAERYVEIAGVRYSHIVDPRTGLGLTGRSSVTVVAPDGASSDSVATAISVLGPERGLALAEQLDGIEALIVWVDEESGCVMHRQTAGFEGMLGGPAEPGDPVAKLGPPES